VGLARTTTPMDYEVPATLIPETWSGEGQVTPSERAANAPFWPNVQPASFSAWVMSTIGANVRSGPGTNYSRVGGYPYQATIQFDGWTYGERINDIQLGTPDERWYRIAGTNNWIASAIVFGNASGSTPLPPAQPQPQPQPQPTPHVPINSGSANYRDGRRNPFAYRWQGQCTWYTYGRMLETGLLPAGTKQNGWFLGHAESWRRDAIRAGLPVTSTPTRGARGMVVWPPYTQGTRQWGHVAFLEEVYPDGRIRISESNWAGKGISERTLTPAQYSGLSFVRLENATPKPQFSSPPATPGQQREYRVRPGDTLWAIAQRELGDGNRWREIQKPGGGTFTDAEARRLQVGQSVYLPVSYQSGTGNSVTSPPSSTPSTNGKIHWVNFSGTVGPKIGVNLRNSPQFSDRSSRNEPNGKRLEFDAWTYGETGTDMWLGTPDNRWFKVKGTNLWVPSCWIYGNPPSSGGGNSGGDSNPQPNPQPPAKDYIFIPIERDNRIEDYQGKADKGYEDRKPNIIDHSTKLTLGGIKNTWSLMGFDDASELLRHYLDNTGNPKEINLIEAEQESSSIRSALQEGYKIIETEARKAVKNGYKKGGIVIGTKGYEVFPYDPNWKLALGHFDLAHGATFEVVPNSGKISINVGSQLKDTYDFSPKDNIGGVSPYRLHESGLAHNFVVFGELQKHYTIPLSPISLIP